MAIEMLLALGFSLNVPMTYNSVTAANPMKKSDLVAKSSLLTGFEPGAAEGGAAQDRQAAAGASE